MQSADPSAEFMILIETVRAALRDKQGVGGRDLGTALSKARRRLPRRIFRQGQVLSKAEPMVGHPKLVLTLDHGAMRKAGAEVLSYLETVDVADRRKGWWLGMLGGMAFNILLLVTLLIGVLVWRELI
ncbi:hypothetical protein K3727_15475 [Rhodobacteraceae bacterium M382]|nr:hypothetical protein K3727_15475 [Rhodobacteraceae bacterium M382]